MPMNRSLYPDAWEKISLRIRRDRAWWRCEGSPAYPDCRAFNGLPHPVTGSKVVLTVAHLDHQPMNCDGLEHDPNRPLLPLEQSNLRAWCQRCHLTYDKHQHYATRRKGRVIGDLFDAP